VFLTRLNLPLGILNGTPDEQELVPRKTASIKDPQFPPARTRSEDSGQALSVQREKGLDFNVKDNRKDFVSLTL
jgi:hypothetical protein